MKIISNAFKQDIEDLVADYEKKSTGEIVPVLLKTSDSYPSAHFRWALFLSILFPSALYLSPFTTNDPIEFLAAQALGIIMGFLLAFNQKAKRLLFTKKQMNEEVYQRALQAYVEHQVIATEHRNGVLLFLSFFERRIHIFADTGISKVVSNEKWQEMINETLPLLKKGQYEETLQGLIHKTGELLTEYFPRDNNQSENNTKSRLDDGLRTD